MLPGRWGFNDRLRVEQKKVEKGAEEKVGGGGSSWRTISESSGPSLFFTLNFVNIVIVTLLKSVCVKMDRSGNVATPTSFLDSSNQLFNLGKIVCNL